MSDSMIDHPNHYNDYENNFNGVETIVTWEMMGIGHDACMANAIKYLDRAGKKPGGSVTEDMEKAHWYVERSIASKGVPEYRGLFARRMLRHLANFDLPKSRLAMQDYIDLRMSGK